MQKEIRFKIVFGNGEAFTGKFAVDMDAVGHEDNPELREPAKIVEAAIYMKVEWAEALNEALGFDADRYISAMMKEHMQYIEPYDSIEAEFV